jgi:hypothetical protein
MFLTTPVSLSYPAQRYRDKSNWRKISLIKCSVKGNIDPNDNPGFNFAIEADVGMKSAGVYVFLLSYICNVIGWFIYNFGNVCSSLVSISLLLKS